MLKHFHRKNSLILSIPLKLLNFNPEWLSLRDSLANRITIKNNALSLTGSSEKLETLGVPSFLAVRQTEHAEIFQVDIAQKVTSIMVLLV